ncbi:hypothetical protein OPV22_023729 [Ensete ventricosum]|uniref:Uncharacterized protein n=1 Tax=Ensete ventricosum TaxID=4639 RepID=A0AAV8QTL4_ENSVE|nr:hypothetical protein OPV22_023729 [Ensete ventricosum]
MLAFDCVTIEEQTLDKRALLLPPQACRCHLHAGSRSGIVSELSEMVKPGWFLLTVAAMQRGGAHINGDQPLLWSPTEEASCLGENSVGQTLLSMNG